MQSCTNIFRQKTSEYLFELLLKPEVWYDILYYVTLPISVTDRRWLQMESFDALLIAVIAGAITHVICRWIDRRR